MISENKIKRFPLPGGNSIPQIGYGTYKLKDKDCVLGIEIAINNKYTHIDTASCYKNGDEIRKSLENLIDKKIITREEIFITSKIAPDEQGYDKAILAAKNILKSLNTDYLDLLLIHWPGVSKLKPSDKENATIRLETWKALEKLKELKLVRNIGVSNFLKHHLIHLIENSKSKPCLNQIEIHPFCYDNETIDYCRKNNILIEAYSSLARNHDKLLSNLYFKELSKKYSKSICQIALKWGLQNDFIIIPKSKTEKYIKENIDIFDFELEKNEIIKINSFNENLHTCWDPKSIEF